LPWQTSEPDERYHTTLFRALLKRQLGSERPFQLEINDDLPPPPRRPEAPALAPDRSPPPTRLSRPPRWRMHAMMMGLRNFVVQVRLQDGATVTFQQVLAGEVIAWPARLLLILLVLLVSVAMLAAWAVRALTRPLTVLASAAGELGRDIRRPPLVEIGPLEVRAPPMRLQHHAGAADPLSSRIATAFSPPYPTT
jgi:hypothetical protein